MCALSTPVTSTSEDAACQVLGSLIVTVRRSNRTQNQPPRAWYGGYWLLSVQRTVRQRGRSPLCSVHRPLLGPTTDRTIGKMEEGLNKNFLQHCGPYQPLTWTRSDHG